MNKLFRILFIFFISCVLLFNYISCSSSQPVIIWTDKTEIVSYVEFFNVAQNKNKAIVVYKDKLAVSLPPAKDEESPDIVIGSFLFNSRVKKNFSSLEKVFSRSAVNPSSIYSPLLDWGKVSGRQYLIPVSFNIPAMIFSSLNQELVSSDILIDCDTVRDTGARYNQKNEEIFLKMGYAPSWNKDFLFHVAKMNGAEFGERGSNFSWNADSLKSTVNYFKDWSREKNGGTEVEQDFSFKYLYTPVQKLVSSGRCLFAYTTSDVFFEIPGVQTENIMFRWLSKNEKVYVNDSLTSLGLYKKSRNKRAARDFIVWFLTESTQKNLLDRSIRMNLGTQTFGICNGFSSIKSVNERVFPAYYKNLLGNLPAETALVAPLTLPARWESLKERVIVPYLSDATNTDTEAAVKTIEERIITWRNQFN